MSAAERTTRLFLGERFATLADLREFVAMTADVPAGTQVYAGHLEDGEPGLIDVIEIVYEVQIGGESS